jgi:hypothetical protein
MGWVVNASPRPLYPLERDLLPIVHEDGRAPGSVWTGAENLAPTGARSPDRPARRKSLYSSGFGGLVVGMLAPGTFGGLVVSMLAPGTQVLGF